MSYSRHQWSTDFLKALGNSNPTQETVNFVDGWSKVETSAGQGARYNLLNTEEHATGSTNFNAFGVQNFVSYHQGVDTNAWLVKTSPSYKFLYEALRDNRSTLLHPQPGPISTGISGDLQVWVSGSRDGNPGYVEKVYAAYGTSTDTFPGDVFTPQQLAALGESALDQALTLVSQAKSVLVQLQ